MFLSLGKKLVRFHNSLRFGKDEVFRPIVHIVPMWMTPNMITWGRTVLTFTWIPLAILRPALWQAFLFFFIYFLDLLDGAVARLRNQVTKEGTYVDHISDKFNNIAILLVLHGVSGYQFNFFIYFIIWDIITAVWIALDIFKSDTALTYARSPFEVVIKTCMWAFLLFQVFPAL